VSRKLPRYRLMMWNEYKYRSHDVTLISRISGYLLSDMNCYYMFRLELTITNSIPDIYNSKYVECNAFKHSRLHYNLSESSALYSVYVES
jgi:hypothetical protein